MDGQKKAPAGCGGYGKGAGRRKMNFLPSYRNIASKVNSKFS